MSNEMTLATLVIIGLVLMCIGFVTNGVNIFSMGFSFMVSAFAYYLTHA